MRVLMIAPQPFFSDRGTPMNVRLLCKILGEAGHEIDLLVLPTGRNVELKNVRIIPVSNMFGVGQIPPGPSLVKLVYDVLLSFKAFWLCSTKKYDVVHGIEEGGFLAVLMGKLFKKHSVVDMDSCISDQLRYSGFLKSPLLLSGVVSLEKLTLANSSLIITVCDALTQKAKSFAPRSRIVQLEDIPLQTDKIEASCLSGNDFNRKYGLLENSYKVLYTGNLERYQGIDLLLYAWKKFESMNCHNQPVELVLVGGPDKKVLHYKKMSERLGLKNICWVGHRPVEEIEGWLKLAHILVSPRSQGDNTPLKIYTYMNSGCPVVATNNITHTQVMDESLAFLADPKPEAFARAMHRALFDRRSGEARAAAAKKKVEEKYSYPVFRKKFLDAYARFIQ